MNSHVLTATTREQGDGFKIAAEPRITAPRGFTAGGINCGIRRSRLDLGIVACTVPATAAAVYTTNAFQAAPLKVTQASLAIEGKLQALVVNSGVANACTGEKGEQDARAIQNEAAELLGIPPHYVGVGSTGVIGERLPVAKMVNGLRTLAPRLAPEGAEQFCEAILTTDTVTKKVQVTVTVDGCEVHIAGAAKGSGMIKPNMATMLSFITTDAVIPQSELEQLLRKTTDDTYNMITVDGDTSTNDTVTVLASGLAEHRSLHEGHPDWLAFAAAFHYVNEQLAQAIARDGEGATKLVEVNVCGAHTVADARRVAKTIVGSSLVKTAVFGADVNWGRVICAIGYAGASFDATQVDIAIGGVPVVQHSVAVDTLEADVRAAMQREKVVIDVDLHAGDVGATAWGCDLTYDYVRINASYRT